LTVIEWLCAAGPRTRVYCNTISLCDTHSFVGLRLYKMGCSPHERDEPWNCATTPIRNEQKAHYLRYDPECATGATYNEAIATATDEWRNSLQCGSYIDICYKFVNNTTTTVIYDHDNTSGSMDIVPTVISGVRTAIVPQ
jgi:hypothetical protein